MNSTASAASKNEHVPVDSLKDSHKTLASNEDRKRGAEPVETPSKKKNSNNINCS